MILDEECYNEEEIKEDFNKIMDILNKHNKVIAKAHGVCRVAKNGALLDEEEKDFALYSHLDYSATNALFFMNAVLQPSLQKYIDLYINHFSEPAIKDYENALEEAKEED